MRKTILALGIQLFAIAAFGQAAPSVQPPAGSSLISDVDTYVKIIAGALAGLATLLGLPIVFLTYKKTRAEIAKLDLEAAALREKLPEAGTRDLNQAGGIRISLDHSPNTTVQVLADPRFLAPLLLLLDFVFAWVILSLAGYLLSLISLGILRSLALAILSAVLLLPIAKQVLRVRAILHPPESRDEMEASIKQARFAAYMVYLFLLVSALAFGALLIAYESEIDFARYGAWLSFVLSAVLVLGIPFLKARLDRYLFGLLNTENQPVSHGTATSNHP